MRFIDGYDWVAVGLFVAILALGWVATGQWLACLAIAGAVANFTTYALRRRAGLPDRSLYRRVRRR